MSIDEEIKAAIAKSPRVIHDHNACLRHQDRLQMARLRLNQTIRDETERLTKKIWDKHIRRTRKESGGLLFRKPEPPIQPWQA